MTDTTKHRARGNGSIYHQKGCKTWTISYPIGNGKRKTEPTHTTNKTLAQQMLRDRMGEVDRGEWVERPHKPVTVQQLHNNLLAEVTVNQPTPKRLTEVNYRWAHLQPVFGAKLASAVSTESINRYKAQRQQEGAASGTINRELAHLRHAFRLGQRTSPRLVGIVPYFKMLKEAKPRQGFVEDEGFDKLCRAATEPWLRLFLELAYTYPTRKSELLRLQVKDVDLRRRTIWLSESKNDDPVELVMSHRVAEFIALAVEGKKPEDYLLTRKDGSQIKDERDVWAQMTTAAGLGSWVCAKPGCGKPVTDPQCARCGGPMNMKQVDTKKGSRRVWKCESEKCGGRRVVWCKCGSQQRKYRGLIPHDFRRSSAKRLRRAGVPESVIMAMGRWRTREMFWRYGIVSSRDQQSAIEALERAVQQNSFDSALICDSRPTEQVQ